MCSSDPDSPSFFGRPSWAAAAHDHLEVLQFFLDRGARVQDPRDKDRANSEIGKTALGVAAYMGHQRILPRAIYFAAQGNRPDTLRCLLERYRETETRRNSFLRTLDSTLVCASRRGAALATGVLLEFGADPNESDNMPRSCLQNAARAGDAETVRLLVEAGASCEASWWVRRRTEPELEKTGRLRCDALTEAGARGYRDIEEIIEEAMDREAERAKEKGRRDQEGGGRKGWIRLMK
ncbi:hypothetical protein PG993_000085 [Apiospora rasikravindrae]|uniref:Ankyrin n=1 Tax=Apiospora rasikravindrae TaxID=990691 RepID=A0ABR1UA94_9PEZI